MGVKSRSFPVPEVHRSPILGAAATLDQIDLAATRGNEWAEKVLAKENNRTLAGMLDGDPRLPKGVLDGDDIVGLYRDGQRYTGSRWEPVPFPAGAELVDLAPADAAFVARAQLEGAPVRLFPYTPLAVIAAADPATAPSGSTDLPEGTKVIAVVDDMDRNAVLDTVAVLPGPKIKRRHDGQWVDDPGWVSVLRSVRPPPVVVLDQGQVASVLAQIDEATKGEKFEPTKQQAQTASALVARADEMVVEWALVAADPATGKALSKATPGGRMDKDLRQYWLYGPGAAKIRWGTPGAWTRCHRLLSKYVGPIRAKGTCTNLGKHLGGHGIAWGVGD